MINTRGRVVWIKSWEVPMEKDKGSKMIHNPKESYYPAYDVELNRGIFVPDITDNYEESDILDVMEF